MVHQKRTAIRSFSSAAFLLTFAFGNVGAYAPLKAARIRLTSPSFLTLPCQEQRWMERTMTSRCRPILFASDPEMPSQETEVVESTSASESESSSNTPSPSSDNNDFDFDVTGLGLKVALGLVAAFAAYEVANLVIATTTEFVTSLSASLQNNFWGFLASLPEQLWGLVTAIFGFLKVFIPAVGEVGRSAYEVASPIVSETSQRAIEAATPVLQDTAEKVADVAGPLLEEATKTANEAAAPYVDQLNAAVETSIVTPIQETKDAMGGVVDAQIQGATKAVETQIQGASKTMGDALDSQFKKLFP